MGEVVYSTDDECFVTLLTDWEEQRDEHGKRLSIWNIAQSDKGLVVWERCVPIGYCSKWPQDKPPGFETAAERAARRAREEELAWKHPPEDVFCPFTGLRGRPIGVRWAQEREERRMDGSIIR